MVQSFPEEWELLWVFESEPKEDDHGNFIQFAAELGEYRYEFECWRLEGAAKLAWWHGKEAAGHLDLKWIRSVAAETKSKGSTALEFEFEQDILLPLRWQLRPHPSISWGVAWAV